MKWKAENIDLMVKDKTMYDEALNEKRKDCESQTIITKTTNKYYLEFDQGIYVDVFLESTEGTFIEKVLSDELAKSLQINQPI
jgi:hypothetical protein